MRTAGPAAEIKIKSDREIIKSDNNDLAFVTVTVADKEGLLVPRSKNRIRFDISGPGEIVAVDNGDATSLESFQSKERNAYNGLCLVIIRARQPGTIRLKAESDGLAGAELRITSVR
jgi:beta-galactosidase